MSDKKPSALFSRGPQGLPDLREGLLFAVRRASTVLDQRGDIVFARAEQRGDRKRQALAQEEPLRPMAKLPA